ncbi:hypothetical protein ES695_01435 [Candidatus Atribacteria bacterium 1244-E10-H5-B2]|nr:MAG: hypothetical protein ES695_01435 [Candidatus Atribacteria bacterium 1244-E10-H5-B2]
MRKLLYLIVAIVLLGLVLNPLAQALPQGQGVQMLPPGEASGRESENIWVWQYLWSNPHPEVYTGTWFRFDLGWGSSTEETHIELLAGLEMEFYLDDKEVKDPLKYFTIKNMGTYWALTWIYRHPPFKPGEHSWVVVLNGSVPAVTIDGAFTVIERE